MEALQRVHGVSFPDDEMMAAWARSQQEAGSRDHRRIGEVGGAGRVAQTHRGSVVFLPWPRLPRCWRSELAAGSFRADTPSVSSPLSCL